jgi:pilus assembly protein CpaE
VCPDPELACRITSVLAAAGLPGARTTGDFAQSGALTGLEPRSRPNICFLEPHSDPERACEFIRQASALMPVIGVTPQKDADLILRCVRAGACEFVSELEPQAVGAVMERISRTPVGQPERHQPGSVYCVIPAKPGSGASTVALHLALQMRTGGKVLLVDTDPFTASIGFMLRLKPGFHLGDVLRDWRRMDDDLWAQLRVQHEGMDVLLAPESPATRLEVGRGAAEELVKFLRDRYSTVVLDMADARSAVESGLAAQADRLILVTTCDIAALHTARRAIEFLDIPQLDHERLRLVVNRCSPASAFKKQDLKTVLRIEPYAFLNNDEEALREALLNGRAAYPRSTFGESLRALSAKIQGKQPVARRNTRWPSFLSRSAK